MQMNTKVMGAAELGVVDAKILKGVADGYIKSVDDGRKQFYPYCMLSKYGGACPDDTPLVWPPPKINTEKVLVEGQPSFSEEESGSDEEETHEQSNGGESDDSWLASSDSD